MRWHAPVSDAQQVKTQTDFPTPAELADRTPADRDRAIDVIRITSLIGVVVGHTVMATSIIRSDVLIWDNLLTTSPLFQALTWIFQIMPLFFFAGVAACEASWRPGTNWGGWLLKRCTRLFRPVFYYLAFWAVALTVLSTVAAQARLRTDRRRQHSAAVVPRRLCAGAGRDADAVSDHHHRPPRRWRGHGLRSHRASSTRSGCTGRPRPRWATSTWPFG